MKKLIAGLLVVAGSITAHAVTRTFSTLDPLYVYLVGTSATYSLDGLTLTYGVSAATASFSSTVDVAGQFTFGAENHKSTGTVNGLLTLHEGLNAVYGVNAATGVFTNAGASSLDIGGGLNAGTGNVAIIGTDGRIPALSTTYLADLSGANLTAITAANISAGSLGGSVIASSIAVASVQDASIVGMTSSKLSGALPAISGASLTNLTAANIDAGTLGITVKPYSSADCEALTPVGEGEWCYDTTLHKLTVSTSTAAGGFEAVH